MMRRCPAFAQSTIGRAQPPAPVELNALFCLAGQIAPAFVAIALIPVIVRSLGNEAFGILSLGITILNMATILNGGLDRAVVKGVADRLAQPEAGSIAPLVWSAVALNALLGVIVGSGTLLLRTPGLLSWLGVPPGLLPDAADMFAPLAWGLPFVFVSAALRSTVEATRRFLLISCVRGVFTSLLVILPASVGLLGGRLPAVGAALALSRVAEALCYLLVCLSRFPDLRTICVSGRDAWPIIRYGGWVTVSNLCQPIFVHLDRFVIATTLSVRAVAFYAAPADVITRLSVLPGSLSAPLFPALATRHSAGDRTGIRHLHAVGLRYVLLGMGAAAAVVLPIASPVLEAWLGEEFAHQGAMVAQCLAVAMVFNGLSYVPLTVLYSVGRPDLVAKNHLAEVPLAVGCFVVFTQRFGIAGTAAAWGIRALFDFGLLTWSTVRLGYLTPSAIRNALIPQAVWSTLGLLAVSGAVLWVEPVAYRVVFLAIAVAIAAGVSWRTALSEADRDRIRRTLSPGGRR